MDGFFGAKPCFEVTVRDYSKVVNKVLEELLMKTAVFVEPGKMEARELPKAEIKKPTDAVLKIVRACVCGSDLWWYRGISK